MNYDDWLVWQEHEYRGWNDPEFECPVCDRPVEKEGEYCCSICFETDMR